MSLHEIPLALRRLPPFGMALMLGLTAALTGAVMLSEGQNVDGKADKPGDATATTAPRAPALGAQK
ncbi:hypothetical protein BH11PLA1_BH11PLA1_18990 [soil metagenome]